MQAKTPNLWQYAPANSPLPLPDGPIIVTKNQIHYLSLDGDKNESGESFNLEEIQQCCAKHKLSYLSHKEKEQWTAAKFQKNEV